MKYSKILVRYGELTTKGKNRKMFINTLTKNVKRKLSDLEVKVTQTRDRMYIDFEEKDQDEIINRMQKVFGLVSFSLVQVAQTEIEDIKRVALEMVSELKFKTFKVESRRNFKAFPLQSMQISREVGAHILRNTEDITVDVHTPDVTVSVEVRKEGTYLFVENIKGAGGYPVGVGGKGMLMISGGIDSPVAGYLTLKRGVAIEAIHFASPPHTSDAAREKVETLLKKLSDYAPSITLHVIHFTTMQEHIVKYVDPAFQMTVMRRMMYRITEGLAEKRNNLILVNGESIGQVASQTLRSMHTIESVINTPVIRPVATYDKNEIIDIAKKIDTYETSILPFEDCCTIFLPKNPQTAPKKEKCEFFETKFDYQTLVDECLSNVERVRIEFDQKEETDDLF